MNRNIHVIFIFRGLTIASLHSHIRKYLDVDNKPTNARTRKKIEYILPDIYDGVENWPLIMLVPCWNCDIKRNVVPAFIVTNPSTVDDESDKLKCVPFGHFCSWPCSARYIMTEMIEHSNHKKQTLLELLCIFEEDFSGQRKIYIPIAPPKTIMSKYSGKGMSEDEYYDILQQMMTDHVLLAEAYHVQ